MCPVEDEMLSFVDGTLESQRRRQVLAHIDECEACRELAAELARENDDAPPSSSRLETGGLVSDRFVLGGTLGKGAMGTVLRARDKELGIDVALKLLRRDNRDRNRAAFARELKVGRKITHPNVCRLYDAGTTSEYDYITMELIEGDTLAHLVAKEELTRERALEILAGIAAGLGAAHDVGVVHRDLKPANVMIEEKTGRVVLTDFGFAMDLDAKHSRRLVGTPAYWSPEQARGEKTTPASDVYSFGVLAYRLLSGAEFSLSDSDALDRVPRDLRRAVERCVALRPAERFQHAQQAGEAFASSVRPRRGVFALLAIAAVGVAAIGYVATRSGAGGAAKADPAATPSGSIAVAAAETASATPTAPGSVTTSTSATAPASAAASAPAAGSASSAVVEAPSAKSTVAGATAGRRVHLPVMSARPLMSAAPAASSKPAPAASDGDLLYRR